MNTTATPSPFTDAFTANADEFYSQLYISVPIGSSLIVLYCLIRRLCINQCEVRRNESEYLIPADEEEDYDIDSSANINKLNANNNNNNNNNISHANISSDGFIEWIKDIWSLDLNTFYSIAGFDALVFILFLESCMYICLLSIPYSIIILLPVYATSENKDSSNDWLNTLSLNTVGIKSHRLYATLIGEYIILIIALYYLSNIYLKIAHVTDKYFIDSKNIENIQNLSWFNYNKRNINSNNKSDSISFVINDNKSDIDLKQQINEINEEEEKHSMDINIQIPSIDRYTVMINNLPIHLRNNLKFKQFMEQLFPNKILKTIVIPNVTQLNIFQKQIKYHKDKLKDLSIKYNFKIENIYNNGDKIPEIYGKIGCCYGICGNNINLIQYHITQKDKLISKFNNSTSELTPTAFVIFKYLSDVSSFISSPKCLQLLMVDISKAPQINNIYWSNLSYSKRNLISNNLCIIIAMTLLLIFWSIPVIGIQGLANLEVIFKSFGGNIHKYFSQSTISWLQGFLTVLILDIWLMCVPFVTDLFSQFQKPNDRSTHELYMIKKYYICLIFMVLLVTVITSSILSGANNYQDYFKNFVKNIGNIADILAKGLSNMSVYFLLYILLNTFMWLPLELFRPSYYIGIKLGLSEPNRFQYSIWIPKTMLIFTIILTYSVMNPIMSIFGLIYFIFAVFVFKYHLSMSWINTFNIGPKLWILMFNLIRYSFVISNITLYGYILLKQSYICSVLLIPLLIFIWIFTSNINEKFKIMFNSSSLISAQGKDAKINNLKLNHIKYDIDSVYLPPVMSIKYKQPQQPYYQLQQ